MFFWTEGKIFIIDEWVCAWDILTVKKHRDRLLTKGESNAPFLCVLYLP